MSEPSIGILNQILNNEIPSFSNNVKNNDDGETRSQIEKSVVSNFRQEAWYCLFIGIPLIINLVIIYYVIKWFFFKYKFDYVVLPTESPSAGNYDNKGKTLSKQNINDDVAILNDLTTVSTKRSASFFNKVGHLSWPYNSSIKTKYPEYEKMSKVLSKNRNSKNIDVIKQNKKLRGFSILSSTECNENIISLRKLSAKYDSVLLQLSAMSCHRGFKRLLKTMKGSYNVAKQHEKQFLDKLFESKVKNKLVIHDSELIVPNDLVDDNYTYEYTKASPTI